MPLNMRGVTVESIWAQGLTPWNAMVTSIALKITTPPTAGISGIELTSAPGSDNTYGIGDIIQATVTFSEAVDITGTPQLELAHIGSGNQASDCTSGTNTTTMTCSYTVVKRTVFSIGITPGRAEESDRTS